MNYDCVYLDKTIISIYSWSTDSCHGDDHTNLNNFFICDSYSPSPTKSPSNSPSTQPTMSPNVDMIEIDGSWNCVSLTDNIDIIYDITYLQCVYDECLNRNECIMINYIPNSKTLTDSRCYIFDGQCMMTQTKHNENNDKIAIKTFENICMDYPYDWSDKHGDKCYHYQEFNWCLNEMIYDGNDNITINQFIDYKDDIYNLNAIQTCCECGGGVQIIDNVTMTVGLSLETNNNNDDLELMEDNLICEWKYKNHSKDNYDMNIRHKTWNNLQMFDLCLILRDKLLNDFNFVSLNESISDQHINDIDCNIFIDSDYDSNTMDHDNDNIIICDYNKYNDIKDIYFILLITIDSINNSSTFYLNSAWINLTQSLLFKPTQNLSYSQCKTSIQNTNNYALYTLIPCDISPAITSQTTIPPTTTYSPSPNEPIYFPTSEQPSAYAAYPTSTPTPEPSVRPTKTPINTNIPSTSNPSLSPTNSPSVISTTMFYSTIGITDEPTIMPSMMPTAFPTDIPTLDPTLTPSFPPSPKPTYHPVFYPTSSSPTISPSQIPSIMPTQAPSKNPTESPSYYPTTNPTVDPSIDPTSHPTNDPTDNPTGDPTDEPTNDPSSSPSHEPSPMLYHYG